VWGWGTRVPGPDGVFVAAPSGPVPVAGIAGATDIGASCAVVGGDTARCWGVNNAGQVGNGLAELAEVPPVAVKAGPPDGPDLHGIDQIGTGLFHTCARMADATVRCWGAWPGGPFTVTDLLGDDWAWPTPVAGLEGVQQLATGDSHACALVTGGTVRCWGSWMMDEPGSGAWVEVPVLVPGISTAVSVYAGAQVSCAILDDGSLHCWGQPPTEPWVYTPTRIKVG
jgi:alpha-tubulin suppressor-like RCC1 family protein